MTQFSKYLERNGVDGFTVIKEKTMMDITEEERIAKDKNTYIIIKRSVDILKNGTPEQIEYAVSCFNAVGADMADKYVTATQMYNLELAKRLEIEIDNQSLRDALIKISESFQGCDDDDAIEMQKIAREALQ